MNQSTRLKKGMDEKDFWRSEKVAFLALASVKGIGFWTIHKIAQSEIGYKDALKDPDKAGLAKVFRDADFDGFEGQERLWAIGLGLARQLAAAGVNVVFKEESNFPPKLRAIPDAPEWLFIQGNVDNLIKNAITIVGTRKPSTDGLFLTKLLVASLAKSKMVTVSGLALGIDQVAHTESIRFGLPTVAVLGTGIFQNYPKGSEPLRQEILQSGGTIISEYLPHQSYSAENFVRRNRLQAALGDILVPAEWQIKSGTAHTVKYAWKYEKTIFNIYLPGTFDAKPELAFSSDEYSARNLQLPFDLPELFTSYSKLSEDSTPIETSSIEVSADQQELTLKPKNNQSENDAVDDDARQLPLI